MKQRHQSFAFTAIVCIGSCLSAAHAAPPIPDSVRSPAAPNVRRAIKDLKQPNALLKHAKPPELAILNVERSGSSDPVVPGATIPVQVRVRNSGGISANVYAATLGDVRSGLVRKGGRSAIPPGGTVNIPLTLEVTRRHMRGTRFQTSVFLVDAHARGTGLLDLLWKDGNKEDNHRLVEFDAQLPARITGAALSVYAVPFERWCEDHSTGTAEGRVSASVSFQRRPDGTLVPAYLVVNTGAVEVRKRVGLGVRNFTVDSDVLDFPARTICRDRCVSVRLEPVHATDAPRLDRATHRACIH